MDLSLACAAIGRQNAIAAVSFAGDRPAAAAAPRGCGRGIAAWDKLRLLHDCLSAA